MTQSNSYDDTGPTAGSPDNDEIREIEGEIAETRGVISEDLRAIGEKLSASNMKAEARQAYKEVKQAAKDKITDTKDAALHRVRDAKDAAVESISEKVGEAGDAARHASDTALSFVRENAVPLALIGVGAAWLMSKSRRTDRTRWERPRRTQRVLSDTRERVGEQASRAGRGLDHMGSRAREVANGSSERIEDGVREAGTRLRHRLDDDYAWARDNSRELFQNNPLMLGAAAVAAGVGVGLLLPISEKENRILGERRDRLLGDAKSVATDAKQLVREVASDAKQVAKEFAAH